MSVLIGQWWSWLAGIDRSTVPEDAVARLTCVGAPHSWSVFLLVGSVAALIALTVTIYRREISSCPRYLKILLATLRVAVIVLLLLVFLGPAVTFTQTKTLAPSLVLLRDASYSMSEKDRYQDERVVAATAKATGRTVAELQDGQVSRAEIVDTALTRNNAALLRGLLARGKVQLIDFSSQTSAMEVSADPPDAGADSPDPESPQKDVTAEPILPPLNAVGQGTDLLRAIRAGLATASASVMILYTDGQHTVEGSGRGDLVREAEKARDANVPLFVVGVGDPTRIANLTVADLYASSEVWKNDPFEIQAVLRLQNISTPSIELELLEQRLDESGAAIGDFEAVRRQTVDVPEGAAQVRVALEHVVREKGNYAYTIRAERVEGELNPDDNQPKTPVQVRVLSDIRVLLIAGQATWEYQLLKRLLQREKSVTLSCWLQHISPDRPQDGNKVIDRFPATATELRQYDVVLLLDPDPRVLDADWIERLKDLVGSEARGLLYLAGDHYATQLLTGGQTRQIGNLLPVEFGDLERMELEALDDTYAEPWQMAVVARHVDHPIMRFLPSAEETLRIWQRLPAVYWSFPARGAKPAGRTLIERDASRRTLTEVRRPLLISGMYGAGRTVYMGFNGTWRWRKTPNEVQYYRRFWLQMIRYLVEGRSAASQGRGVMETDRESYTLGDRVTVYARRLKDATYDLIDEPEVTAVVRAGGGDAEPITLKATPGQPGNYSTTISARRSGLHKIVMDQASATPDETPPTVAFRVALPQLEAKETWLNKPLLTEIAEASGGAYYELDELDKLLEDLPDRTQKIRVRAEPIPLWDNSRVLLLLVGLLCAEWALRKKHRLM